MKVKTLVLVVLNLLLCNWLFAQSAVTITANEAKRIIDANNRGSVVVVDGRDSLMFAKSHINGAVNIDAFNPNVSERLNELKGVDTILVYSTKNNRANSLTQSLAEIGYSGVVLSLENGITAWNEQGFETITSASRTHVLATLSENPYAEFPSKGKVIVQVFGNFDYNATSNAQKSYGFWFGRAHLGYEYQFDHQFTGKVIIDAGRPTTVGQIQVTDPDGNDLEVTNPSKEGSHYTMTLKFASLEWRPNGNVTIQVGGVLQNHYITQEKFWGYRYIAPTFQDRYYGIPSGDLGAIGYFRVSPKLRVDIALTNGEGFRFDQDAYGDVKLAGGVDYIPVKGLETRFFYDITRSDNPVKPANQQLYSLFAGYKHGSLFRIGGEYNYRKNHLGLASHDIFGLSVYGATRISKRVELFARYDKLSSNTLKGEQKEWYYNHTGNAYMSGFHYVPVKGINVSLNYQGWQPASSKSEFQHHIILAFEYKL